MSEVAKVFVTTDYTKFKFDPHNRAIKQAVLAVLRPSIIRTGGNIQSIVIDRYGNILDGQHRYMLCKELKLPIRYEVRTEGYRTSDIIEINNHQQKWSMTDRAEYWSKQGNTNYDVFLKYRRLYPDMGEAIIAAVLANKVPLNGGNAITSKSGVFQAGNFIVFREDRAKELFERVIEIGSFYKGYRRRAFVYALLVMSNHKGFSWDRLIDRLHIRHISLYDYPKASDYVTALEEIYNYRRGEKMSFA